MGNDLLNIYSQKVGSGALHPDKDQEKAAAELARLHGDLVGEKRGLFKKKSVPKGVYLWGGVGRGKSMLMDLFFENLPDKIEKRRVHFHEFMIETHDFLHKARQEKDAEAAILKFARKVSKETQLLCFDEFHVTDIADAMILGRLFTALFERGLVVVGTSNWPPHKLYEGGLQRELFLPFIDLLQDKMVIVEMNGETDYRLQCLGDTGVYFSPLGPAASKSVEQVFVRLTDGVHTYDETLSVKGRDIHVPVVAKGVARFSFSALCEEAMGAEDYLKIAENYHTVFLEDVPRIKASRRNEAKRFMTLIDALYDRGTKLVMTADAPPEEIYKGDDHGFEFQRTVSRLIEMQGSEYLGL